MSWAEKKRSPPPSPITSLPEDVVVDILARVPVCDYPRVSLVSKRFRSLVSRSSLGCTEHCLYVVLRNRDDRVNRLFTLRRRKDNGNSNRRLVLIPGRPDMPPEGSFVAVGSRLYVFDGMTSSAFFIDCTSHTVQHLPKMPAPMSDTAADVIGGRIYVIGFISSKSEAMVVFDTETQTWVTKPERCEMYLSGGLAVMACKMYARGFEDSFVYDPKESKWETDEVLDSKDWENACVVDDVLYFYDYIDDELRAYDPEHKCWGVVKGLDDFLAEMRRVGCHLARTVSYAGKLVLFFHRQEIICCAEISLERRKGRQIWGKDVDQWCDHALIAGYFIITKSLDVVL
ncbi:hypothetical protein Bca52824_078311 [Brassica carinata]|uniref:F-box domain-containing protein n=1 Tax=Brassica carinata TaxID=52824 RepID=A0A8X7PYF6_BRACI|nr:hypothetical protein Bca52824_078311 [Brassica carinata]